MKIRFELENPNDMNATATMTMTVREWEQLLEQLKPVELWPAWQFKSAIRETIYKARASFSQKVESP